MRTDTGTWSGVSASVEGSTRFDPGYLALDLFLLPSRSVATATGSAPPLRCSSVCISAAPGASVRARAPSEATRDGAARYTFHLGRAATGSLRQSRALPSWHALEVDLAKGSARFIGDDTLVASSVSAEQVSQARALAAAIGAAAATLHALCMPHTPSVLRHPASPAAAMQALRNDMQTSLHQAPGSLGGEPRYVAAERWPWSAVVLGCDAVPTNAWLSTQVQHVMVRSACLCCMAHDSCSAAWCFE